MPPLLRVAGARKSYGATTALAGADLSLEPGEWVALLGPNGAGKTTLIRAIAGRVRLDAGSITLFDQRVSPGDREPIRALGLVPQEIALYPLLTARENLETFGRLAGVTPTELPSRVEWALEFTRLADRAAAPVKTFSGGMKRRLNIAAGVLHRPRIVLLDEPTVGVDPQSRALIWEMLETLRQDGASLLLTTHQLDEAQQVCDRIVIIDHGRVIADGTLDELIERSIGRARTITVRLDRAAPAALAGSGVEIGHATLSSRLANVAVELPQLLNRIAASGVVVEDVRVDAPSLHGVFLHLTGRDLRE
jgi:ABC-2 type transport system ATP-binding protein